MGSRSTCSGFSQGLALFATRFGSSDAICCGVGKCRGGRPWRCILACKLDLSTLDRNYNDPGLTNYGEGYEGGDQTGSDCDFACICGTSGRPEARRRIDQR